MGPKNRSLALTPKGAKFGLLVVSGESRIAVVRGLKQRVVPCLCECGTTIEVTPSNLVRNHTTSCGCGTKKRCMAAGRSHGLAGTKLHMIWVGMQDRCHNPGSKDYENYGARGIAVCEEWRADYRVFLDWAMSNGYEEGLSIDRIDNDGPYQPDNCRWIPLSEQRKNQRRVRLFTAFGETKCAADWFRDPRCKVSWICLNQRLNRLGWDPETALTASPQRGTPGRERRPQTTAL